MQRPIRGLDSALNVMTNAALEEPSRLLESDRLTVGRTVAVRGTPALSRRYLAVNRSTSARTVCA